MRNHLKALLGAALLFAITVPVAADPEVLQPDGVYVQAPTGMAYPPAIGEFRRVNIVRYNPDGTDESAGYNRERPGQEVSMTVYVFRSPRLTSIGSPQSVIDDARDHLCADQFRGVQGEITQAHPDATPAGNGATVLEQNGRSVKGYKAVYTLNNPRFFGRSDVASRSEAYLFCFVGGKWTVEYRVDYPADYDANTDIADFMRSLVWTIPPEN